MIRLTGNAARGFEAELIDEFSFLTMFETTARNQSTNLDLTTDLTRQSAGAALPNATAYGLQSPEQQGFIGAASGPRLDGSSLVVGGTTLIVGGVTTAAEITEVNTLLAQAMFNRDQVTGNRNYTNNCYAGVVSSSADESVGYDRGDYLSNAIDVGTVVYRSGATIQGFAGYTYSGVRDADDYYRFQVGKSGDISISLTGLSQNIGLALYDTNGALLNHSDQGGSLSESILRNLNTGTYYARVYSYSEQPWGHGQTGYTLNISRNADALEAYWRDMITDSSVENAALNAIRTDSSLSRADVIGILKSAGDGGSVTNTELTDLRNFYNNAINTVNVATDLKVLSEKVLFADNSNQWYTGSDSLRDNLGNLAAGSSTTQLNLLLGKHFLGTDRPAIGRDGSNNLRGSYTRANGSLFVGGASASDIDQGATGSCYFLSALGGTANDKNAMVSDMFRDNGDGTWSVRFFTNGKTDYVTVDRMMATDAAGRYIYADDGAAGKQLVAGNNELWAALAEKAYAQVNESGRIGQDGTNFYGNGDDNGIGWGSKAAATTHITGLATTTEGLSNNAATGLSQAELVTLVTGNRIVTVGGFNNLATNSNAGETSISTAVQGHAYTITGYDAITGRFSIRNPWGAQHLLLTFAQLMQLGANISYSNS